MIGKNVLSIRYYVLCIFILPIILYTLYFIPKTAEAAVLSKAPNNLGLIGYWSFDEATGTKVGDSSGNNNHGVMSGATLPVWRDGRYGKSLYFATDETGVITMGNFADNLPNFTTSAWFKTNYFHITMAGAMIGKANNLATGNGWVMGMWANSFQGVMQSDDGAVWVQKTTAANYNDNEWHHGVSVFSNGTVTLYIDGVAAPMVDRSGGGTLHSFSNSENVKIGNIAEGDGFSGELDDIRIYNRALTATEIQKLYQSGSAKVNDSQNSNLTNGLIGLWSFDGKDISDKIYDRSGQGNNGYFVGGSTSSAKTIGKMGQGLKFDGGNDYINLDNIFQYNSTICTWINPTDIDKNIFQFGGTYPRVIYRAFGNTGVLLYLGEPGFRYSSVSVPLNSWTHLCFFISELAADSHIYVNGVLSDGTPSVNITHPTIDRFKIGGNSSYFNGSMDDVRIYNRALSAAEVKQLYGIGAGTKINTSQNTTGGSLDSGLVGLWSFNGPDISGTTAYDRSGSGNDGTITGATKTIGKVGQALSFNGSSNYIYKATFTNVPNSNLTICTWLKTPSVSSSYLFTINRSPSNYDKELIYSILGGKLLFYDFDGSYGFNTTPTSNTSVADNKWHHTCFTKNGINGVYYLDGSADGTATAAGDRTYGSNDLVIGYSYRDNNLYFNGSLDDLRIYNRTLSAAEIKQLYNLGK